MEEIKCNCGSPWFRTMCYHHEGETGTKCVNCNKKIYIDWGCSNVIEERN